MANAWLRWMVTVAFALGVSAACCCQSAAALTLLHATAAAPDGCCGGGDEGPAPDGAPCSDRSSCLKPLSPGAPATSIDEGPVSAADMVWTPAEPGLRAGRSMTSLKVPRFAAGPPRTLLGLHCALIL